MNVVTLDRLLPGEAGTIQGYAGVEDLHHRLKELGLVAGTRVRVRRCAPLGDPMELSIRGYHLSIRKQDARGILIRKDEGSSCVPGACGGHGRHRHRGGQ
ncbi:MAG: FeoA family protein [Candidatus Omnitrophota bacterium]